MPDPVETQTSPQNESSKHYHSDARPAVLDQSESRQGSPRLENLRVLIFSLAICIVVLLALLAYWFAT